METKELLKDYIAILCEDAERTYEEQRFIEDGIEVYPEGYDVPQEVIDDARDTVEKFHAAFPDSLADGGDIYIERTYAAGGIPLNEMHWLCDNIEPLKGTPTIFKDDDGKFQMEVE